ncbi:MAG: hypothetical protein JXR51_00505 [Bacteroidales bacterium]|nr:hypothetical protein [Bacteroidales bacterium]MBN2755621.1 hypothetical protein [Bacteroidales bacterium]
MRKVNLIVLGILFAISTTYAQEAYTKKYHKEYKSDNSTTIEINNRYGNVHVENWEQNSISIDVLITVKNNSKERAENTFKKIDITFKEIGNTVSAITEITESINNIKFSIDYNIKIPKDINVNFSNKYGDLFLDELNGHAQITTKYGNLTINKLSRGNVKPLNYINISYSTGVCNINESDWLQLETKYSKVQLNTNNALMIESKYSSVKVKKSVSIVSRSKYDHPFRVGTTKNFITTAEYSNFEIENVLKRIEADVKYSDFDIKNVANDFDLVKLRLRYGSSDIKISENASYTLEAEAAYGSVHYPKSNTLNKVIDQTESKIWGKVGNNKNTDSKVIIDTKYGSVNLE